MKKIRLKKKEIAKVKNRAGIYRIYPCNGKKAVYIGSSKKLRHRLQSYYQKDDFSVNRTKADLRPSACKITYSYMPIMKARKIEKKEKKELKFNVS